MTTFVEKEDYFMPNDELHLNSDTMLQRKKMKKEIYGKWFHYIEVRFFCKASYMHE